MKVITKNKAAFLNYDIEDTLDVGIVLKGHEVKSVKTSHVNIKDAIVRQFDHELFITNMDIPLYEKTSPLMAKDYQAKGLRKLLITKKQLAKRSGMLTKGGLTMIPLEVFLNAQHRIKLKIALGKLRRKVEKKQILKEREVDREARREMKDW